MKAGDAPGGAVAPTHNPLAATLSLFSCEDCDCDGGSGAVAPVEAEAAADPAGRGWCVLRSVKTTVPALGGGARVV